MIIHNKFIECDW